MADVDESILFAKAAALQCANKEWAPGELRILSRSLVWRPDVHGAAAPQSVMLAEVTGQKKAKGKPLLKVEAPGAPLVFMFDTEDSREAAVAALASARDAVGGASGAAPAAAVAAAPAAPAVAPAPAPAAAPGSRPSSWVGGFVLTAEQRAKLLDDYPDIRELHARLVRGGALSEAEFWRAQAERLAGGAAGAAAAALEAAQRRGPRGRIFDVQDVARDGSVNRVTVSLTRESAAEILAENTAVRRAYLAHVPHNLSEEEFWRRYVRHFLAKQKRRKQALDRQSRRARAIVAAAAGGAEEDADEAAAAAVAQAMGAEEEENARIFGEGRRAAREGADAGGGGGGGAGNPHPDDDDEPDEEEQRAAARARRRVNPAVDLDADQGDGLPSGYGLAHGTAREAEAARRGGRGTRGRLGPGEELLHEINAHGQHVVLPAAGAGGGSAGAAGAAGAEGAAAGGGGGVAEAEPSEEVLRRLQRDEGLTLDDLVPQPVEELERLNITDPRKYFGGGGGGGGVGGGGARGARAAAAAAVAAAAVAVKPEPGLDPASAAALGEDAMDVDDKAAGVGAADEDPAAAIARLEVALLRRAGGGRGGGGGRERAGGEQQHQQQQQQQQHKPPAPPPPAVDPSLALVALLEVSGAANAGAALDRAAAASLSSSGGAGGATTTAAAAAAAALAAASSSFLPSAGGAGALRPAVARAPADALPQPALSDLRGRALVVNELLRHLWACIPANTPAKQQKVARVCAALGQQYDSVTRGVEVSAPARRAAVLQLSRPLMEAMERAFDAARAVEEAVKRRERQQQQQAARAAAAAVVAGAKG